MLDRIFYYKKRVQEAPLHIIVRKLWRIFFNRLYNILYFLKKKGCLNTYGSLSERCDFVAMQGSIVANSLIKSADQDTEYKAAAIKRGQATLKNEFQCLGYGLGKIPSGEEWHSDQFHNYSWPNQYFIGLDFVSIDIKCDVKVPWEYSRLQFLPWLAEAALFDPKNKSQYIGKFQSIVADWSAFNKPGYGVNWVCPMEVAIRAVNLLLAAMIIWPDLSEKIQHDIIKSCEDHAKFITRFLEFSDVPGNHYLSNLMGIVAIYEILSGPHAKRTQIARNNFHKEAAVQFEDGGCQIERAPIYNRLCLDMVALVCAFEAKIDSDTSKKAWLPLKNGIDFCGVMASSTGELPIIADCDSGQIMWFGEDARKYNSLENFVRAIEDKSVDGFQDAKFYWWMAIANHAYEFGPMEDTPYSSAPFFADRSGFLSIKNKDSVCIMRVGEQGLKGRASHDHDDALSIWMSHKGRDFVIEQGCHSYTLDKTRRAGNISSLGHNVVQVMGEDRYKSTYGSIVKTPKGAPTASRWSYSKKEQTVQMEADIATPQRVDQPFRNCSRQVILNGADEKMQMTVADQWSWVVASIAEVRWHFAPDLKISIKEGNIVEIYSSDDIVQCIITFECQEALDLEVFDFDFSPVYGQAIASTGLKGIVKKHDSCSLVSTFNFLY